MSFSRPQLILLVILVLLRSAAGQTGAGAITGVVSDPSGAFVQTEVVLETVATGDRKTTQSDDHGQFEFHDVPFGIYLLRIEAPRFQPVVRQVSVHSSLPLQLQFSLQVGATNESVTVEADIIDRDSSRTETAIGENAILRSPSSTNQMQNLIATTPGWTTENDGLMHIRGVDDGILYLIDGIPNPDRVDTQFAVSQQTEGITSAKVITGNIPAEYGDRSGAVVVIQQKSGLGQPLRATVATGLGSFRSGDLAATVGGGWRKFGYLFSGSTERSNRFLDPTDPRAFHDRGGVASFSTRLDWHPTTDDLVLFHLAGTGSDFHVPNDLAQQLAGQNQRQELRSDGQSVSWQHTWSATTLSDVILFRNFYRAELLGSAFDTPLFASANRHHVREGILASTTHSVKGHLLKVGAQASRLSVSEFFSFAVTDPVAAEEDQLSSAALGFTPANPFLFHDGRVRGSAAWYAQDDFSPLRNLTVNAGVRFDHSSLLVSDHQLSPRIGTVYYVPATKTAFRASFNRLYMPPQVENLLLASSEQVRRLSPFPGGGAPVLPEKSSALEAGVSQQLPGMLSLKLSYWWRYFRNIDDPNVFFGSTIVFPNSVAEARAKGLDARLELAERKGWSGYVSYTNSRITEVGPLNGGVFLTDDFIEIGSGTEFTPDHDQRNVAAAGATYNHARSGLWASFSGRYESGVPMEVAEDEIDRLRTLPGADLVNFARGRVKPWAVLGVSGGIDLLRHERITVSLQGDVQNLANRRFVYNFGNPFAGTHFGYPRTWSARMRLTFH